jgi:HEAT repeat protein
MRGKGGVLGGGGGIGGVSNGLKTTFRLLGKTPNEAVLRTLVPALDSPQPEIREAALKTVLLRRNPAGHRVVLTRLHELDEDLQEIVRAHSHRITPTIRNAVLGSDRQFCANGCTCAIWLREYELVPALVSAAEDRATPNGPLVSDTMLELAYLLASELASGSSKQGRRDWETLRVRVVETLGQSVERFGTHHHREIVEAFVALVRRENLTLRQVLAAPRHPAFLALIEVLSKGGAEGVVRLLLSFLDDPSAPSAVLSVVAKRCDARFVNSLLRKVGSEPSPAVRRNLKRMSSIKWLQDDLVLTDQLDDAAQHSAVRLAVLSGMPRPETFVVVEHLLLHGKRGGRRAACEALADFNGAEANALALRALEDEDPQVQAHAADQIRRRGIPGALPRLVELVDSPHAVVRKVARKNLGEFSFHRFLSAFDLLEDEVRQTTGDLVKKVDPKTISQLREEIVSKVRTRRLRGLTVAGALGVVGQVEEAIMGLLDDEDHIVRAEAVATLSAWGNLAAVERAATDPSPTVREAARIGLKNRGVLPPEESGNTP